MIEAIELVKRYGPSTVLDRVSLQLPRGGLHAIIGPNGAGKSTLLAMLARLMTPDSGEVRFDAQPLTQLDNARLARQLAILRQDNHLTMRLSVRDLVSFGRYPHCKGRPGQEDLARVEEALHYMDMTPLADRFLDQLSGGQRQRAFVAMVLAQDTDYILLDEPLNNLDLRHSAQMMALLRRLADERGKTVVIVIHDINIAAAWSDSLLAMKDGRLIHQGSPAQIMRPEVLEEVYDMKMEVSLLQGHPAGLHWLPPAGMRRTEHTPA